MAFFIETPKQRSSEVDYSIVQNTHTGTHQDHSRPRRLKTMTSSGGISPSVGKNDTLQSQKFVTI